MKLKIYYTAGGSHRLLLDTRTWFVKKQTSRRTKRRSVQRWGISKNSHKIIWTNGSVRHATRTVHLMCFRIYEKNDFENFYHCLDLDFEFRASEANNHLLRFERIRFAISDRFNFRSTVYQTGFLCIYFYLFIRYEHWRRFTAKLPIFLGRTKFKTFLIGRFESRTPPVGSPFLNRMFYVFPLSIDNREYKRVR